MVVYLLEILKNQLENRKTKAPSINYIFVLTLGPTVNTLETDIGITLYLAPCGAGLSSALIAVGVGYNIVILLAVHRSEQ